MLRASAYLRDMTGISLANLSFPTTSDWFDQPAQAQEPIPRDKRKFDANTLLADLKQAIKATPDLSGADQATIATWWSMHVEAIMRIWISAQFKLRPERAIEFKIPRKPDRKYVSNALEIDGCFDAPPRDQKLPHGRIGVLEVKMCRNCERPLAARRDMLEKLVILRKGGIDAVGLVLAVYTAPMVVSRGSQNPTGDHMRSVDKGMLTRLWSQNRVPVVDFQISDVWKYAQHTLAIDMPHEIIFRLLEHGSEGQIITGSTEQTRLLRPAKRSLKVAKNVFLPDPFD